LSFNGNKIITTGGGGAILSKSKKLNDKIRHLITTAKVNHKWEYIHDKIGYNLRLPSLNAALGIAQIKKINKFLKSKRKLFFEYSKIFKNIDGVKIFKEKKNSRSNYWLQTLIFEKNFNHFKNKLIKAGYQKKIYMRPVWRLISELKPLISDIGDATLIVPLIKDYMEIGVRNDEQLIKMATIVQRVINSSSGEDSLGITEDEKNQLMEELEKLNSDFKDNKNG